MFKSVNIVYYAVRVLPNLVHSRCNISTKACSTSALKLFRVGKDIAFKQVNENSILGKTVYIQSVRNYSKGKDKKKEKGKKHGH